MQRHPLARDLEPFLDEPELWEPLRGATVFLTGGTGYYGCWFLESFVHLVDALDLRARVVVLTRDPAAFTAKRPRLEAHPAVRLVRGDVNTLDASDVHRQLGAEAPSRCEFVIHAAAETDTRRYEQAPFDQLDTLVTGTRRTLEFAREAGARRFLFTSSGAVYGRQPAGVTHLSEDYLGGPDTSTFTPLNVSAAGKGLAEVLCAGYHARFGLETVVARPFATVGPYLSLDWHFALGNFLHDALAGRPVEIKGDGTPYRSYIYAADQTLALWTILLRGQPGRPYNVGSSDGRPLREVAALVARSVSPTLEVRVAEIADPSVLPERYVPDVSRLENELGVSASTNLSEAILRTLCWHQTGFAYRDAHDARSAPCR